MVVQPELLQVRFVDGLKQRGSLITQAVEDAFRQVPRHVFLPEHPLDVVYSDRSVPVKSERRDARSRVISSSSQPAIMATMLEQLALRSGDSVLEVGTGSGYNAALMSCLVGSAGRVVSVEVEPDLADNARMRLSSAGYDNVCVVTGDGWCGCQEGSPYDKIIVTAGCWDIAPSWRTQVKEGGVMVLPLVVAATHQQSVALKDAGGYLVSISLANASFMLLRGPFSGPLQTYELRANAY